MSDEEDNVNYSDYDEESFDNESIEEEYDESVSELSKNDQSAEEQLEESTISKSLNGSVDKLSYDVEEEEEEDEVDNSISSSNSVEEDDNAVSTVSDNKPTDTAKDSSANISEQKNEHEIDETESDGSSDESESEIKTRNLKATSMPGNLANVSFSQPPIKVFKKRNQAEQPLSDQSELEFNVTSQTPTSFNSDNHAFHMDIIQRNARSHGCIPMQRPRHSNRKSLSFSNERMREIERHNQILLKKILTQKPRKEIPVQVPVHRTTSSAVNRKKQQRQIDMDNQVLKRKIEAIAMRRHHNLYQ